MSHTIITILTTEMTMIRTRIVTMTVVAAFLAVATAVAGTVRETKEGGGEHGYKKVVEYHDGDYHTLSCQDPGYTECCWDLVPQTRLMGYARDQIAGGVYSGQQSMIESGIRYTVVWGGLDARNVVIQETQESVGSVQ